MLQDDTDVAWTRRRAGTHKDQATIDWLREPPKKNVGLPPSQQLTVIERLLFHTPYFRKLSFNLHSMRKVSALTKISEKNSNMPSFS